MIKFIVSFLASIMFASAAIAAQTGENTEKMHGSVVSVRTALVKTLTKLGITIASSDPGSGTLTMDWFQIKKTGMFNRGLRMRSIFTIVKVSDKEVELTETWMYEEQIDSQEPWGSVAPAATAHSDSVEFFKLVRQNIK